jgi:hypothetical protein
MRPIPTQLVFEVYPGILAVAALGLAVVPETVIHRERLNLRFAGLGIPEAGRSEFIAAGVEGFAPFSLLGLFTALAPTFLGEILHQRSHFVGGVVVFAIFGAATLTQLVLVRFASRPVVLFGLGVFLVGLALIVAGMSQASMAIFLLGTVVGGVAIGAAFVGSLSSANRHHTCASPVHRG